MSAELIPDASTAVLPDAALARVRHRPTDRETLRVAVHEMRARGMDLETCAHATGLSLESVLGLLEDDMAGDRTND